MFSHLRVRFGTGVQNPVWLWRREGLKGCRSSEKLRRRIRPTRGRFPRYVILVESHSFLKGLGINDDGVFRFWWRRQQKPKLAEAEEEASGTRVTVTSKSRKSNALFPVRFRCQEDPANQFRCFDLCHPDYSRIHRGQGNRVATGPTHPSPFYYLLTSMIFDGISFTYMLTLSTEDGFLHVADLSTALAGGRGENRHSED